MATENDDASAKNRRRSEGLMRRTSLCRRFPCSF